MAKFTIDDYDKLMEDVRQKRRRPTGTLIERLRETARKRKPRLPRI